MKIQPMKSCCFCVDHGEGVKVLGIVCLVANCVMLLVQVTGTLLSYKKKCVFFFCLHRPWL